MARMVSMGVCELCGMTGRKTAMAKHVVGCAATRDESGSAESLAHLRIEALGAPEYWLHLEAREDATLQQLDALLRSVWLECCGHLSAFRIGRREAAKRTPLGALSSGDTIDYEYDFGSTTALRGNVLGFRRGSAIRPALRVLARNAPLPWHCAHCPAEAVVLCPECIDSDSWLFCASHAADHPCAGEEMMMPVVNSPRMGVCGYTGPRRRRSRPARDGVRASLRT